MQLKKEIEPNALNQYDSIYSDLSEEDVKVLNEIDSQNTHKTFEYFNLDAGADHLLQQLKRKGSLGEETEVFGLSNQELDAAGILAQSGEALLYRNSNGHLCISSKGNALFGRLLRRG